MTDAEEMSMFYNDIMKDYEDGDKTLKVGMKIRSKVHGNVFILTQDAKHDMLNDTLGWYNVFEIVPDDTPLSD